MDVLVFACVFALALTAAAYALAVMQGQPARTTAVTAPEIELLRERVADKDYVVARIMPPAVAPSAPEREIVLLLDTSRVMAGPALEQAKAALRLALNGLKPTDTFNVIAYAGAARPLFDAPRAATAVNVMAARRLLAGLRAEGDSNPVSALQGAMAETAPDDSRLRQVVMVTGAAIDAPARLIAEAAAGDRTRLYMVGVGPAPDGAVLRRAAELGGGTALSIRAATDVLRRLRGLFVKLERPLATDLHAQWPSGVGADAMPHPLPDILAGEPLLLAAKLSSLKGDLQITGQIGSDPWEARLKLADARQMAGIARHWARRKIATLEARRYAGQDADAVAAAVREVALAHGLERAAPWPGARHPAGTHVSRAIGSDNDELALAPFSKSAPAGADAFAAYRTLIDDRVAAIVFLVLTFAGMSALTLSFWRHLRREYGSSRRMGWRT